MNDPTSELSYTQGDIAKFLTAALLGAATAVALNALFSLPETIRSVWGLAGAGLAITFSGTSILLNEYRPAWRKLVTPAALGALIGILTLWRTLQSAEPLSESGFMMVFWIGLGAPLLVFLVLTLVATARETGGFHFPHNIMFKHAVRLPVAAAGGVAVGVAVALFISLWSAAFSALGAGWISAILTSRWTILIATGAAAGIGATFTLHNNRLLGTGETALVIGARILLPLLAVFSAIFAVALPFTGLEPLGETLSPTAFLLALAITAKLVFNGVYQDGLRPPVRPLRWAVWLSLAVLPVYAVMALYGIGIRVAEHGLTPERFVVLVAAALVAGYTVLLLGGLLSEFTKSEKWMPPVARLNSAFAVILIVLLVMMQTPILDPLEWSARSQSARLKNETVKVEDFDFAYMQFRLGKPGKRALANMETWTEHPKSQRIRAKVKEVRSKDNYWSEPTPENLERIEKLQFLMTLRKNSKALTGKFAIM